MYSDFNMESMELSDADDPLSTEMTQMSTLSHTEGPPTLQDSREDIYYSADEDEEPDCQDDLLKMARYIARTQTCAANNHVICEEENEFLNRKAITRRSMDMDDSLMDDYLFVSYSMLNDYCPLKSFHEDFEEKSTAIAKSMTSSMPRKRRIRNPFKFLKQVIFMILTENWCDQRVDLDIEMFNIDLYLPFLISDIKETAFVERVRRAQDKLMRLAWRKSMLTIEEGQSLELGAIEVPSSKVDSESGIDNKQASVAGQRHRATQQKACTKGTLLDRVSHDSSQDTTLSESSIVERCAMEKLPQKMDNESASVEKNSLEFNQYAVKDRLPPQDSETGEIEHQCQPNQSPVTYGTAHTVPSCDTLSDPSRKSYPLQFDDEDRGRLKLDDNPKQGNESMTIDIQNNVHNHPHNATSSLLSQLENQSPVSSFFENSSSPLLEDPSFPNISLENSPEVTPNYLRRNSNPLPNGRLRRQSPPRQSLNHKTGGNVTLFEKLKACGLDVREQARGRTRRSPSRSHSPPVMQVGLMGRVGVINMKPTKAAQKSPPLGRESNGGSRRNTEPKLGALQVDMQSGKGRNHSRSSPIPVHHPEKARFVRDFSWQLDNSYELIDENTRNLSKFFASSLSDDSTELSQSYDSISYDNSTPALQPHPKTTTLRIPPGFKPSPAKMAKCPLFGTRSLKTLIVGDTGVGKTQYILQLVHNTFCEDAPCTVGVDFALKVVHWSDNLSIKLQLWDIAGQERFTSMTRVYYKDARACIVMFDLTKRDTFLNALKWKNDLDAKCTLSNGSPVPCILLANKCDLFVEREVEQDEIEAFTQKHDFIGWTETSVKEGQMVDDSMTYLLEHVIEQGESFDDTLSDEYRGITLNKRNYRTGRGCTC